MRHLAVLIVLLGGCRFESPAVDTVRPVAPLPKALYRDVTAAVGLPFDPTVAPDQDCETALFMTRGAALADVDHDGDVDIFLPQPTANDRLFLNGFGRFVEAPFEGRGGAGATFFDANGDGHLDLFVTAVAKDPPRFYFGDGEGHFERAARGLTFTPDPQGCYHVFSASAADADGDGDLDLFTAAWVDADGSRYFENDGTGQFSDRTAAKNMHLQETSALIPYPADLDDDGDLDVVIAADFHHTRVFEGLSDHSLVDVTTTSTIVRIHDAMSIDTGDVDGDGDLDIFVSGICQRILDQCNDAFYWTGNRFFRGESSGFVDDTIAAGVLDAGWAWGAAFFDGDLDGDLDLVVTNGYEFVGLFEDDPLRYFENDGTGHFIDRAESVGLVLPGQTRSVIPFDLENDGDIDLFVTSATERPRVFENQIDGRRTSLTVRLDALGPNRFGIGARVRVQLDDGRWIRRDIRANSNYLSSRPANAHFGLGGHRVEAIEVVWPDGFVQLERRTFDEAQIEIRR